jgi:hypothetical protein
MLIQLPTPENGPAIWKQKGYEWVSLHLYRVCAGIFEENNYRQPIECSTNSAWFDAIDAKKRHSSAQVFCTAGFICAAIGFLMMPIVFAEFAIGNRFPWHGPQWIHTVRI